MRISATKSTRINGSVASVTSPIVFLNRKLAINKFKPTGGIKYATKKMFEYRDEALNILYQFPDSEVRQALENLVRYTTDRNY